MLTLVAFEVPQLSLVLCRALPSQLALLFKIISFEKMVFQLYSSALFHRYFLNLYLSAAAPVGKHACRLATRREITIILFFAFLVDDGHTVIKQESL